MRESFMALKGARACRGVIEAEEVSRVRRELKAAQEPLSCATARMLRHECMASTQVRARAR